ncbi:GreA/GreB family elongation factor [Candidatus Vecturithrix granuli]|uniref:GreA/GreB family elongation factor n=1 Tax=Vecturithrix granuli TaxID=1499967 RepID=A0A081C7P6_VECG1|nr:GreA/GreB family elongation factor [Candidatus Vecturithrix granuli]
MVMNSGEEKRIIYVTEFDYERLSALIKQANPKSRDKLHLQKLTEELERGEIVEPQEIPPDVITMNSKVRLKDIDSGEEAIYTLVFPHNANIEQNKISVLAPIGTALIGYRVGDIIEWKVPSGIKQLRVEEILYQPEAAGDYDL